MAEEIPKLTTEQIYSLLANRIGSSDFELMNYEFHRLENKVGLLCHHISITTTVNVFSIVEANGDPNHLKNIQTYKFFAKFYPTEESQVCFCEATGAFAKEIFIYKLFEKIRSSGIGLIECVPCCFYSNEDHVIVMEELTEQGYKVPDKYQSLDYETVLIVVRSLAKLHASSILFEEEQSRRLGRPYSFGSEYADDFLETYYHERNETLRLGAASAVKGILSEISFFNFPEKLKSGKDFRTLVLRISRKIFDLVKPSKKHRNVISHGDLWATNFLLKYNTKNQAVDCKLVDFQGGRYLPPSHDLISLLYLTTTRDFRQKHMYDVIGLYYYHLEKILKLSAVDLKSILPFGDFLESCEEYKPLAIYQSVTHLQLVLVDNQSLHELFTDEEFSKYTFEVDRTRMILANIDVNENYRRRLNESILDLQDYCETL